VNRPATPAVTAQAASAALVPDRCNSRVGNVCCRLNNSGDHEWTADFGGKKCNISTDDDAITFRQCDIENHLKILALYTLSNKLRETSYSIVDDDINKAFETSGVKL
jgi:hypothetical protein